MAARLISVIGPPASGKTTLARHLAAELPGRLVPEDFAGNPFLAHSFGGREASRLGTELHFLASRVAQLASERWPQSGVIVTDYGFCACEIFARQKLAAAELAIFEPLREHIARLVKTADALVLLEAPTEHLLARISRRGRSFEKAMTRRLIGHLAQDYRRAAGSARCPVITIDTAACDLRRKECRAELVQNLRKTLRLRIDKCKK